MQRTGRSGNAMFRVVVQDSRVTPTSGKVVMQLGNYDPHAKAFKVDKEKASFYLEHGAQPSPRVARLLQADGVKLPMWADVASTKQGKIRHQEKLRRNRSEESKVEAPAEPEAPAPEAEASETVEATAEATETATTEPEAQTEEA